MASRWGARSAAFVWLRCIVQLAGERDWLGVRFMLRHPHVSAVCAWCGANGLGNWTRWHLARQQQRGQEPGAGEP